MFANRQSSIRPMVLARLTLVASSTTQRRMVRDGLPAVAVNWMMPAALLLSVISQSSSVRFLAVMVPPLKIVLLAETKPLSPETMDQALLPSEGRM